jgi:3-oxoacyl-[acyl-carrier-protein] synthase III
MRGFSDTPPLPIINSAPEFICGMSVHGTHAQIISTARYLPERVVTNAELTTRFTALGKPTVVERLAASTGITKRFYVPNDWVTSDLALPAAKEALKRAGRNPKTST